MDLVRGTPAKYRPPDAFPTTAGVVRAGGGPTERYVERALPAADAILWTPIGQPTPDPSCPVVIAQSTLAAVHAHLAARAEGAASFGFLIGGVYVSPETRIPYIVGESTIHMPWTIGGDHLKSALRQGYGVAIEEVKGTGRHLLGWYVCHSGAHARLSAADVEAHVACFDQPWQVAVVVSRGADLQGGVFRPGLDGARAGDYLPFYELPDSGGGLSSDGAVTACGWTNYRPQAVVLSAERVSQGMGMPPRVFLPDEADVDVDDVDVAGEPMLAPAAAPAPTPALQVRRFPQLGRAGRLAGIGVVAAGLVFGAYRALASGPSGAPRAGAATAADRVALLADSAAYAVAAFDLRARLYDGRKMLCPDLARGLIEVENRWIAYSAARSAVGGPFDSAQIARDRRLHADIGAVEQRFARTGCPRP